MFVSCKYFVLIFSITSITLLPLVILRGRRNGAMRTNNWRMMLDTSEITMDIIPLSLLMWQRYRSVSSFTNRDAKALTMLLFD